MQTNITHEELARRINELLALRNDDIDPNLPNLRFCATLDSCDENGVCLRYRTYSWMANPNRVVHGGMVATMFDNGLGVLAGCFAEGAFTPTVTLSVEYLRPVPLGERLYLRGKITTRGRSLIHMRGELANDLEFEKPYSLATAVFAVHPTKKM